MYINWKPLLFLGFLFWIVLLSTDILRSKLLNEPILKGSPPVLLTSSNILKEEEQKTSTIETVISSREEKTEENYGFYVIFANIIIFVFSIVFCSIAKLVATTICKFLRQSEKLENLKIIQEKNAAQLILTDRKTVTQFGDHVEQPKTFGLLESTTTQPTYEKNNKLIIKKTDQTCQTLSFHNSTSNKQDQALKLECAKLKDELTTIQSNSLKEHALLSRKLETMAKEKRELSKRLLLVQKENQGAKDQLEELLNERKMLLTRLDNANKGYKINIKTKKVALAKLEETSITVNDLRSQLQQATRDREILQGKFEVLRGEYEQMRDRLRLIQMKEAGRMSEERTMALAVEKAEKDYNHSAIELIGEKSQGSSQLLVNQDISEVKEPSFIPFVMSETEVGMKDIKMKICNLERNLEKFGRENETDDEKMDEENEETQVVLSSDREGETSDTSLPVSPKIMAKSDVTCKKTFDEMKVELLRSTLREKIKVLENMREKGDAFATCENSDKTMKMHQGDDPKMSSPKVVSKSMAFQMFLRNIGAETKAVEGERSDGEI